MSILKVKQQSIMVKNIDGSELNSCGLSPNPKSVNDLGPNLSEPHFVPS